MTRDESGAHIGQSVLGARFFLGIWVVEVRRGREARHATPGQKTARVIGRGDKGGRGHARPGRVIVAYPCGSGRATEWRHGVHPGKAEEGIGYERQGCARASSAARGGCALL